MNMLSAAALLFLFPSLSNGFLLDISTPSPGGGSSGILDRNYKILVDLIADERRSRERLENIYGTTANCHQETTRFYTSITK